MPAGSDPKKVTCNTTKPVECSTSVSTDDDTINNATCCIPGGDQSMAVCATAAAPCDPDSQLTYSCDEVSDCPGTEKCFFANGQSNCADDADTYANNFGVGDDGHLVQMCKTNAECGAEACTLKTCTFDTFTLKMKVCGTPDGCQ